MPSLSRDQIAKLNGDLAHEQQKDAGVDEYEIIGTLDSTTCALCGAMDGEKVRVSAFNAGDSAPPFHPMCRCTTAPFFADDADGERIARGEDGETYYVPDDMRYNEWRKQFDGKQRQINNLFYMDDGNSTMLKSEKATEIINKQKPMNKDIIAKVKKTLAKKGIILEQSPEIDKWLISKGAEAVTLSDGTMLMHTNVSA